MTQAAIEAVSDVIIAADRFLEAVRRDRKPHDLDSIYAKVERELGRGWNEQAADFKKEWAKFKDDFSEAAKKKPSATKINSAWKRASRRGNKRHEKILDKSASSALDKGAASAMKDLGAGQAGISFDLEDPQAIRYLKKLGFKKVKGLSQTSLNRIKRLIIDMAEKGASWSEVGKAVDELMGWKTAGAGMSRGELIAVTETGQAYEAGRQIVRKKFEKAGLRTEKAWYAVGDDRVCEICEPAEADGWIPGNDEFSNGFMMPLAHPGCRCDLSIGVVTLSV